MNPIRIGRPGARSERPWPGALSPGPPDPGHRPGHGRSPGRAFRKAARDMMAYARRLWLVVRTAIRAVGMAHHEQVRMWECILETSGAAPLTTAGPLRWVRSLDGYRLRRQPYPGPRPGRNGAVTQAGGRRQDPGLGTASGQHTSRSGAVGHHGSPGPRLA